MLFRWMTLGWRRLGHNHVEAVKRVPVPAVNQQRSFAFVDVVSLILVKGAVNLGSKLICIRYMVQVHNAGVVLHITGLG